MVSPSQILKDESLTFAEKAVSLKAVDGGKVQGLLIESRKSWFDITTEEQGKIRAFDSYGKLM